MLGVTDRTILVALLVQAIAVTLLANWLASRFERPSVPRRLDAAGVATLVANLLWMALVFAAGVIATRYAERLDSPPIGFVIFSLVAFACSIVRTLLARRIDQERLVRCFEKAVNALVYLTSAAVLYLFLSLLLDRPATPILFIPLFLGALVPGLDSVDVLSRLLSKYWPQSMAASMGAGGWHSLAALVLVALLCLPLILVVGWQGWLLVPLGYGSHLLVDLFRPEGVPLFWPASQRRYGVLGLLKRGSTGEGVLLVALVAASVLLLGQVDVGQPQTPPPPRLSFEQNLERYYSWRGRNQVFARVEGSWQATGRRLSGQFEVLNAEGETFVLLDRYDGTAFTAGKQPDDNLYVSSLSLTPGSPVRVKPVELQLEDTFLREALLPLYQMEMEEGLEHIYISGEIVSTMSDKESGTELAVDLGQTRLRKIESPTEGHYTLKYLTAAELIELADVFVETGSLVVIATYTSPATGPTPTPLPLPPAPTSGAP